MLSRETENCSFLKIYPFRSFKSKMWNSQNFSVIQILREINFGECIGSRFCNLQALTFVAFANSSLKKVQKFTRIKIQNPQN